MTWHSPRNPPEGTKRERMAFAWFPLRSGDTMIWLEWVHLTEEFDAGYWRGEDYSPPRWMITGVRQAG